jgi:hypothetical protein
MLPAALRDAGFETPCDYRKLYLMAIDGRFPAFQINNQWRFDPAKLPEIAARLEAKRA